MNSMRRKLTLFNSLRTLSNATSDDPRPTSGYMFDEICKLTFNSTATCSELEDDLLTRLKRKSPHTKAKVLKILKHLVEKGHDSFKTDLQRRTDEIRACMSFKGQPDQMHGDTYNALVRSLAGELMEALFDTSDTSPRVPPGDAPSVIRSSNHALGSSADSSGHGSDSASGGSKYVGFGSNGNAVAVERKVGLGARVGGALAASAKAVSSKIDNMRNKRDDDEPSYTSASGNSLQPGSVDQGGPTTYQAPTVPGFKPLAGGRDGEAAPSMQIDSAYESRLVDEITMPAGVRAAPQKAQLKDFVGKCSSLDSYKIASLLGEKLPDDNQTKTRIRALHVIEALLLSDIAAVTDCFIPLKGQISQMSSDANASIREMAIRVSDLLDTPEPTHVAQATAEPVAAPANATSSLLDLGGDTAAAGNSVTSEVSGGGLFAGLVVKGAPEEPADAPVPAPTNTASPVPTSTAGLVDILGGNEDQASASAPAPGLGGMFSGMKITGDSTEPAAAPMPAAPVLSAPGNELGDLFGASQAGGENASVSASISGGGDLLSMGSQPSSFDPLGGDLLSMALPSPMSDSGQTPLSVMSAPAGMSVPAGFPFGPNGSGNTPPTSSGLNGVAMSMAPASTMGSPQQGFGLSASPQGFGLSGTASHSSPLQGGSNIGVGAAVPSGMGMSPGYGGGNMMNPAMSSPGVSTGTQGGVFGGGSSSGPAQRTGSFGLSSKNAKKSDDPFSFISNTVSSEANKNS